MVGICGLVVCGRFPDLGFSLVLFLVVWWFSFVILN